MDTDKKTKKMKLKRPRLVKNTELVYSTKVTEQENEHLKKLKK